MCAVKTKQEIREHRHQRVRRKVTGTSERPRLSVFKSLKHIYAQIIDDTKGFTLAAVSSLDKDFLKKKISGGNKEGATIIGELIAIRAKAKGIEAVVFDRGSFAYHGRIKELAEAARKNGLQF